MWYDGVNRSKTKKAAASVIIYPNWKVGDRVRHKPSGITGQLKVQETICGRLWKMAPGESWSYAMGRSLPRLMLVHAGDLELEIAE